MLEQRLIILRYECEVVEGCEFRNLFGCGFFFGAVINEPTSNIRIQVIWYDIEQILIEPLLLVPRTF